MKKNDLVKYEQTEYSGTISGDSIYLNLRKFDLSSSSGSFKFVKDFKNGLRRIEIWAGYEIELHERGGWWIIADKSAPDAERFNQIELRIWDIKDDSIEIEYGVLGKHTLKRLR